MSADEKFVAAEVVLPIPSPSADLSAMPDLTARPPQSSVATVSSAPGTDSGAPARPSSDLTAQKSADVEVDGTTGQAENALPTATRGPLLQQPDEMLYRQVHPSWLREGRITSQVFNPFPKDKGLLSVTREEMTTAEATYSLFTSRGFFSVGVVAVKVEECSQTALEAYHDPEDKAGFEDPAHSVIDFRALINLDKERKRRAQVLADKAKQRGFIYRPS